MAELNSAGMAELNSAWEAEKKTGGAQKNFAPFRTLFCPLYFFSTPLNLFSAPAKINPAHATGVECIIKRKVSFMYKQALFDCR